MKHEVHFIAQCAQDGISNEEKLCTSGLENIMSEESAYRKCEYWDAVLDEQFKQ